MNYFSRLNKIKTASLLSILMTMGLVWFGSGYVDYFNTPNQPTYGEAYYRVRAQYDRFKGMTKKELKAKFAKKDRPDMAMAQDFLRTADLATGTIPIERLDAAHQEIDDRLSLIPEAAITGVNWTERGPSNVGGRTRALMYDPNDAVNGYKKVWAGGVGGGLWLTNDISAGPSWTSVDNFWDNIAISCITYDPSNIQVFYVGTGEGFFNADAIRGAGIWKTTNGGSTWAQIPSTSPAIGGTNFVRVNKITVASNGNVVVCDRNGGLRVSTDGGTTWTQKVAGNFTDSERAADGTLYAALNTAPAAANKLYRSTDNGVTWTDISASLGVGTTGGRLEIACAPSNASILYVIASDGSDIAWFKKSINAATSWTNLTIPKYLTQGTCAASTTHFTRGQSWYDLILRVNPTDPNHVLAGGVDVHRTTDGGTNWTSISYWTGGCGQYVHADIHAFDYKPGASTEMLVGCDGGVFRSADITSATPTFTERNTGYNVTQFYSAAIHPTSGANYFLAGAQDNGSHKIVSTGIQPSVEVSGGDGAFCFIDQDNPCLQITSYVYNNWYVSSNGGNTFPAMGTGANDGDFINPADYHDPMDRLYSSADGTATYARWTVPAGVRTDVNVAAVTGGFISHIKASPYSPATTTTLYIGTGPTQTNPIGGQVIRIPNAHAAGPVGTDISNAAMRAAGSVSCIEFGASENEIVVTYSNYGTQSVWYTSNGGTTWTSKDTGHGLPDMPIRWALINPNNTQQVMLATEAGVWTTDNINAAASATFWEPSNNGLAHVRCDMLQYRASDGLVAIGTHGRGLFTTDVFATTNADFNANNQIAYIGSTVTFSDASIKGTSWSWDFGAGATPATATGVGPHNVVYSSVGTKTVVLTINGGASVETKTNYVNILPNRTVPYLLANGGNFEVNTTDFATVAKVGITGCATMTAPTNWERGNSATAGKSGVVSGSNAWVTGLTGSCANLQDGYLFSPNFNFATAGCTYTLSFSTKHSFQSTFDGFVVEYSTDKGASWSKLNNVVAAATWYNSALNVNAFNFSSSFSPSQAAFTGSQAAYAAKTCDVSFLAGNADVAFRFLFVTDDKTTSVGGAIDDFQVTSTCPTITLGTVTPTTYCAGATISVPYTTTGTFNAGNVFTAQLSDATGSFAAPIATGTGVSPISITIPAGATTSTNYLIRVVSSNPVVISNNSPAITINALPVVSLTSSDADNTFCAGTSVTFTATAGFTNYNFFVAGVSAQNSAANTFVTTALTNGQIVTVTATNAAGCSATSTGITNTVNALPVVSLTSSDADNTFCAGTSVTFTATAGFTNYNFFVAGVSAQNSAANTFVTTALTNGQIVTVTATNAAGCSATSTGITNTVNALPVVSLTSSDADNTFCAGTSVTFTATAGFTNYNFFVAGVSAQNGAANTFVTTALTNGQIVTVTATNAAGCSATSTGITNTVNALPVVSLTSSDADNTFCAGTSVTFTATAGFTNYNFFVAGVSAQNGAANTFVTTALTNSQIVTVTATNAAGCTKTSTGITNTVNALPVVSLTSSDADNTFCAGTSVTFTATAGFTNYNFFVAGVSAQNGAANTFVTTALTNGQIVTVTATNAAGCSATSTGITNTVNALPVVSLTSSDADNTFCAGTSVTFTATAGFTNYNFFVAGVSAQNSAANTFVTTALTNTQIVTVTATNASACSATSTGITNTVNALPVVSLTSSDADNTFCAGTSVTFTATAGFTNYNFFVNGVSAQNSAANTFVTTALTNGQIVTVTATNASACSATSTGITNTVNALPVVSLTSSDADNTFCAGTSVTFTATAGFTNYNFFVNGVSAQNSAANTFVTTALTNGQIVTVTATNAAGCSATSTGITNTVNALPVVSLTSSDADNTFCAGTSVTFTATAGFTNYNFFVAGVSAQNSAANTFVTTALTNGQIVTVTATNASACSATSTGITNIVNALPVVSLTSSDADNTFCAGTSVTFTATAGFTNYNFFVNGVSAQNSAANTFVTTALTNGQIVTVTATNASACSATSTGITNTVNPLPVVTHSAITAVCSTDAAFALSGGSPTGGVYSGTGVSAGTFTPATAGVGTHTITYTVTTAGCTSSTTVSLTVNSCASPTANFTALPATVCVDDDVTITDASALATSWDWNFGVGASPATATGVGPHTITYSSAGVKTISLSINGGVSTTTKTVTVNALPVVSLTSSDADNTFCAGTSVTFTATAGLSNYEFFVNGVTAQNGASNTFTSSVLTTGQTVSVRATNAAGCLANSTSITNTVTPLPVVSLTSSDADNTFCAGSSVTFTATAGFTNYNFFVAGSSVQNGASNAYTATTLTNGQIVTVTATSAAGCSATSAGITNTVSALPIVTFTSSDADNTFCAGTSVTFTATAGLANYEFFVNGVSAQNGSSNTFTTTALTNGQTVTVTARNVAGCLATPTGIFNIVNALPVVTQSAITAVCSTDAAFALSGGSPAGGVYSGTGVSAGNFTPATAGVGTHTITYTVTTAGCTSSTTVNITVNNCAVAGCTWTGAVSSDWTNPANWSCGTVPTCADDVTIPAGPTTMPIFTAGVANVHNVTIAPGATLPALTVSGGTFNVCGNWTNSATTGHFVHTNGTVIFVGATAQTVSGLNVFEHVTINNGGLGVTLNAATQIKGLLDLQNGNLTSNGNLTLLSDATGTAMVVNNGANVVIGDVTVQRHITPYGARPTGLGYTYISNPTTSGTVSSILGDDLGLVFNPAYKWNCWLYPAPLSSAPFPNAYVYNESLVNVGTDAACMNENQDKFETAWQSAAAGTVLNPMDGAIINISGNSTIDATGTLNNGTLNKAISKTNAGATNSGWNLVGNPYPAPINWDLAYTANSALVGAQIMRRMATGTYSGTFGYYTGNVPASGTNGATNEIAGMQGFFVRALSSGNLQFTNAMRSTAYSNPQFFRTEKTYFDLMKLELKGSKLADETTIYFGQNATDAYEENADAWKSQLNSMPAPNLFTQIEDKKIAINGFAELREEQIIPLSFIAAESGKHTLKISHFDGFENVTVYLEDKKLNVLHEIVKSAYRFDATKGANATRFQIRFKPSVERASDLTIGLYPNPATSNVKVQMSKAIEANISIVDMLGRKISENTSQEREINIDIKDLPKGVYIIEVKTSEGVKTAKFVKE